MDFSAGHRIISVLTFGGGIRCCGKELIVVGAALVERYGVGSELNAGSVRELTDKPS
jgi:hypothetical protein